MIAVRATNAACGLADLWMRNAQGDDPCKIASALIGMCDSTGVYNVPPISSGLSYPPPSKQEVNRCQCNTVAYSLMSACAVCQGGTYPDFMTWTSNCSSALIEYQGYPNQSTSGITVPSYGFLPLASNNEFDLTTAQVDSTGLTMSTSSFSTSATTMTFFPSTGSTTTTTPPTSTPSVSTAPSSAMGMKLEMVIAVVVGLTLLSSLAGFFLFYRFRRGRSHDYQAIQNRTIQPKDPETRHDAKTAEYRPASLQTWAISHFRWPRNTSQVSSYGKMQLPNLGVENTPPLKPRSQTQTPQIQSYKNEAKIVEQRPVSLWAMLFSNLGLRRNTTQPNTSPLAPYEKIKLPAEISQTPMPMPTYTPMPPGSSHQPNISSPRPRPTRIDTLPVMQTISRARPEPRRSYSSTLPEASTSPRESLPPRRAPEGVRNVPRPADFRIEDTPTTADGYPTSWKRKKPPVHGDIFNPEIGGSTTSLTSNSMSTYRNPDEDSDSVLLITRSREDFDIASISSKARSVAPSVSSKAKSIAPSVSSKRSLSEASVGDSSRSMAGSSMPPTSPAAFNGYRDPVSDSVRYGVPEARRQLFPASVRAAGYTGVPRNHQG